MLGKPLYENVGIGTIIKRIGECNALIGDYDLSVRLTQQSPREDECKDLCITVGSKIVVIDFKAPDKITSQERLYRNVKTRRTSLIKYLGSENILLGLFHAALTINPRRQSNGYFLNIAVPATTIFVPLSQFTGPTKSNPASTVNLGDIRIEEIEYIDSQCDFYSRICRNSEELLVKTSVVPSCYHSGNVEANSIYRLCRLHSRFCPILWESCLEAICSHSCFSCGGLCDVNVHGMINNKKVRMKGYTLASLLWMIRGCKLGYRVESNEKRNIIMDLLASFSRVSIEQDNIKNTVDYIYLFTYTPGIGFQLTPLSIFQPF